MAALALAVITAISFVIWLLQPGKHRLGECPHSNPQTEPSLHAVERTKGAVKPFSTHFGSWRNLAQCSWSSYIYSYPSVYYMENKVF